MCMDVCVCERERVCVCVCVMQRREHTQNTLTKNPISMGYWVTYLN